MAETACHLRVEDIARLGKGCKSVCVEYCRPSITIVARLVARGEDMVVESGAVAGDDFGNHAHLLHGLCLEGIDIEVVGRGQLVVVHIEDRRGEQFGGNESLVEGGGTIDFRNEAVGHDLARLVVESVGLHDLGAVAVVLHELGGQFDEVSRRVGACEGFVGCLREESVERVSELVEEGLHIVHAEQRGVALSRFVEVTDIDDYRAMVNPVGIHILMADIVHPCAGAFACAGKIVGVEDTDERAVGIGYLENLHLGVIDGHAFELLELQAIERGGELEHTAAHIAQLEIGFEFFLVEVVLLFAEFLGVVPPVPRLQFLAREVFVHECL